MTLCGKAKTTEEKLLIMYGFLGTMPIVEIFSFTAFTWMTLIMLLFILVKKKGEFKISGKTHYFIILSCFMIVSSIVGVLSEIPSYWKRLAINNAVWQLLYVVLIIYYLENHNQHKCLFYIKGVYYAAVFQSFWGILQLLVYKATGTAINKVLFYDILGVAGANFVQMRGGSIAITGLCRNAANLVPLLIIGYLLTPSIYIKLLFLLVTVLSGSRTLLLGMAVCVAIDGFFKLHHFLKGQKKGVKRIFIVTVLGIIVIFSIVLVLRKDLLNGFITRIKEIGATFNLDFLRTQDSSRVHSRYWTTIPMVTRWNTLIHNLFGYGINCSGYPFAVLFNQYADHAWTVECDYINNLWGIGYVGFILWYVWYGIHIVKGTKISTKYLTLFIAFLVAGVTYNITFNWCYIMLIMIFGLIDSGISIFQDQTPKIESQFRGEEDEAI